jgi:hypothetical protein
MGPVKQLSWDIEQAVIRDFGRIYVSESETRKSKEEKERGDELVILKTR